MIHVCIIFIVYLEIYGNSGYSNKTSEIHTSEQVHKTYHCAAGLGYKSTKLK